MTIASALFIAGVAASCASSRDGGGSDAARREDRPQAIAEPIAPNHCRFIGTILEVTGPDARASSDDPCSKFPCTAKVRVDAVLGYGSGFSGALAPGAAIEVRFLYTLAPSREAFPNETFSLPGLGSGDRFSADLSALEELVAPGAQGGKGPFGVALYRVLP